MEVNTLRPLEKIHSNVSNEGTQDNQVQEVNNNVNIEDNRTKRKKKQGHLLPRCTRKGSCSREN
jgi:hypothetical protein